MTNYVKQTDFAAKDALASGTPAKIVKGTELDDEFASIATHIATKADKESPTFTGVPKAPTAAVNANTTQVASTAFVKLVAAQTVPTGFIILAGFSSVPTGYLAADGSTISRAGYADLFAAIGTTFGVGDGSTTFELPNPTPPTNMTYFIKH